MKGIALLMFLVSVAAAKKYKYNAAIATLHLNGTGPYVGFVQFLKSSNGSLHMHGKLIGIPPSPTRLHGLHIHECGDLSKGCESTKVDYSLAAQRHGSKYDSNRHIGDLGNIRYSELGEIDIDMYDNVISFSGRNSIIGRSLVIHQLEDDLGKVVLGKGPSKPSTNSRHGNAGKPIICGTIGWNIS